MAAVRDCGFEYSPDEKNTWLGSSIGPMMRSYSAVEDFFEDQDESFYTMGIQA